ncbi:MULTISPECIES: hypothetical protein [Nocardioides]|uniref:hypothetical protein n=1 Tax=Nocardioides TaxID=1839 RepID=UPI0003308FF3|nr:MULTISPECIES: hypothetical protein [Nocardioides]EON23250.1 hypothetical protein CF8_2793 [Nocardioides sp. CF8]
MNDTIRLTPEVDAFVAAVRARFSDLGADEREDLLDGLEADMADLVAERGPEALGDPDAYAAELRAAAGLAPAGPGRRQWSTTSPTAVLDAASTHWSRLLDKMPADIGSAVRAARPAWWVFRAWLAVMWFNYTFARWAARPDVAWLPTPSWGLGLLILAVASIVSIQIGRGKIWPGTSGLLARVVLLVLNVFALLITFDTLQRVEYSIQDDMVERLGYNGQPTPTPGLTFNGQPVTNVYPFDAAGNPLVGVQLVDDQGRRLKIDPDYAYIDNGERVLAPWLNGRTELYSVFPLPERDWDDMAWEAVGEPTLQAPPFAVLPPVTLDGVTPTVTAPVEAEKRREKKRRP